MKFLLVALLLIAGVGVFGSMVHVKTDVNILLSQREDLILEQRALKEQLQVMRTELAYLARPQRLQGFAEKLELVEMKPKQIGLAEISEGALL